MVLRGVVMAPGRWRAHVRRSTGSGQCCILHEHGAVTSGRQSHVHRTSQHRHEEREIRCSKGKLQQDSLPLTLRGNTDHRPRPYYAGADLAKGKLVGGGGGCGYPDQVTLPLSCLSSPPARSVLSGRVGVPLPGDARQLNMILCRGGKWVPRLGDPLPCPSPWLSLVLSREVEGVPRPGDPTPFLSVNRRTNTSENITFFRTKYVVGNEQSSPATVSSLSNHMTSFRGILWRCVR